MRSPSRIFRINRLGAGVVWFFRRGLLGKHEVWIRLRRSDCLLGEDDCCHGGRSDS